MTDRAYAESIELPTDQIFKHLKNAKRFTLDIGKYSINVALSPIMLFNNYY